MHKLAIVKQLEEELKNIERELLIELPKEISRVAAYGDLRENAEYQAAKERQSFLQARASHLRTRISDLSFIKLESLPKDKIAFGSKVFLEDLNTGKEVVYELVAPEEVDPKKGKISIASPIGRVLLNKKVGDEVVIHLPARKMEYEIKQIIPLHDMLKV